MGGAKAFQRHGRGILVHDNGITGITNFFNDMYHGEVLLYIITEYIFWKKRISNVDLI